MPLFEQLRETISQAFVRTAVKSGWTLPSPLPAFKLEMPRDPTHGDFATNIAMLLAKPLGQSPRALAEALLPVLQAEPSIAAATLAGPGFINLRLQSAAWQNEVWEILQRQGTYGLCTIGAGQRVNIEYVSANPTGPMHAGHVRGAVIGDTLATLLQQAGYAVTREYYFNDAGAQVDVLARTTFLRYREALGEDIGAIPEGFYPGEYLKDVGQALAQRDGKKWLGQHEAIWLAPMREFAVQFIMGMIREDLQLIGIKHDVFTNERELIDNGTLEKAFALLEARGLIYTGTLPPPRGKTMEDWEPVPLTLFRSSQFGDSTDRPLKKRDGQWAYIMPDIAYHFDKVRRGFTVMINILGKDHGGYLERMRPAVAALSDNQAQLNVVFNSIVKLYNNGELVKLSKRSGNLITLREMVEQVGAGAVRFFMLTRTPDSELTFDFAKVVEQSRDNPVFYVQYAHARCCSVIRHARTAHGMLADDLQQLAAQPLTRLTEPAEIALMQKLSDWPRLLAAAAVAQEPHQITYYLIELATAFHALWNTGREAATLRFLQPDDREISLARLALVQATRQVLTNALAVLGVTPLDELRDPETVTLEAANG
ncbi:MAG: arginine--tRNA ligase [Alphaproteobacteria bacterium]|nr:arginine--tRNA ligase [Alphaproteobacteria bacterium]